MIDPGNRRRGTEHGIRGTPGRLSMIDDPFLRALEQANPVPHARDVELPPLGPLPPRRRRDGARGADRGRAGARDRDAGFALAPSSTPGGNEVLARAFARRRRRRSCTGACAPRSPAWARSPTTSGCTCAATGRSTGSTSCASTAITGPGERDRAALRLRRPPRRRHPHAGRCGPAGSAPARASACRTWASPASSRPPSGPRAARSTSARAREVDFEGREAYEIRLKEAEAPIAGPPAQPLAGLGHAVARTRRRSPAGDALGRGRGALAHRPAGGLRAPARKRPGAARLRLTVLSHQFGCRSGVAAARAVSCSVLLVLRTRLSQTVKLRATATVGDRARILVGHGPSRTAPHGRVGAFAGVLHASSLQVNSIAAHPCARAATRRETITDRDRRGCSWSSTVTVGVPAPGLESQSRGQDR